MKIRLLAFGIAKDIIGGSKMEVELNGEANIAQLKSHLIQAFPDFEKLRSLAFAVNTTYQEDDFLLGDGDEVVLIPPVSGG